VSSVRGILREEVLRLTSACKDLTMISGIKHRADLLEALGIPDYEALIACDPARVVTDLRACREYVSALQVERWQLHALAYRSAAPVLFGPAAPVRDSFLALDLEYDPMVSFVWLVGVLVCEAGRRTYASLWADRERDQRQNLQALGELVRAHPSLPVVTWGGTAADIPHLQTASRRYHLQDWLVPVFERHVDLCDHAVRTIRLPIPSLGLKEVARYFGIEATTTITDGREADVLFGHYQRSRKESTRQQLREELVAYNRDDLDMLVQTHEAVQGLHRRVATPATRWYARRTQESLAAVISVPASFSPEPPHLSRLRELREIGLIDQGSNEVPF
jgi:predicted RecB family nuclease